MSIDEESAAEKIDHDEVRIQLDSLQKKLLDISNRNNLINHRHNNRHTSFIRVVDESLPFLFSFLQENEMQFKPLPSMEAIPKDELDAKFVSKKELLRKTDVDYLEKLEALQNSKDVETERLRLENFLRNKARESLGWPLAPELGQKFNLADHAKLHGFNPDYDLKVVSEDTQDHNELHTDKEIQTLFTPDQLDRRLRSIRSKIIEFQDTAGINVLRGAFGFLEYYDSDKSKTPIHAPIILLPLKLELSSTKSGAKFTLSSAGEEPEVNITLQKRLKDLNLELPDFDIDDPIEDYFNKLEVDLSKNFPAWRIRRFVTIGLFPFQKIAMYHDLSVSNWFEDGIINHEKIATLLGGLSAPSSFDLTFDDPDIDQLQMGNQLPKTYFDADSSQYGAIIEALSGKDLVIQGPPGTGKSQTIANLIAAFLDKNKSVLFLAEKQAALSVVADRLRTIGLEPGLLEMHKVKAKNALHESLAKYKTAQADSYNKQKDNPSPIDLKKYDQRSDLKYQIDYKETILSKTKYMGLSLFDLNWKLIKLQGLIEKNDVEIINFSAESELTKDQKDRDTDFLNSVFDPKISSELRSSYRMIYNQQNSLNPANVEKFFALIDEIFNEFQSLFKVIDSQEFSKSAGFFEAYDGTPDTLNDLWCVWELSRGFKSTDFKWISLLKEAEDTSKFLITIGDISKSVATYNDTKSKVPEALRSGIEWSLTDLRGRNFSLQNAGFFTRLFSSYKKLIFDFATIGFEVTNRQKLIQDVASTLRFLELENIILGQKQNLPFALQHLPTDEIVFELTQLIQFVDSIERVRNFIPVYGGRALSSEILLKNPAMLESIFKIDHHALTETNFRNIELNISKFNEFINFEECNIDLIFSFCEKIRSLADVNRANLIDLLMLDTDILSDNMKTLINSDLFTKNNRQEVRNIFEYFEVKAYLEKFFSENPDGNYLKFSGKKLNEARESYVFKDKRLFKERAKETIRKVLQREPVDGVGKGKKSLWTETPLINHELTKKKKLLPIRKFLRQASRALRRMKPLWMMSPIALSHFHERKLKFFDVLIIDEASQMRPEDAFPAIARAKQIIVVGDNKQLPPTNHFTKMGFDDDDDDGEDIGVQQESILDLAVAKIANQRMLRWHYRSRHPDLIKFSSHFFYDGKLVVFPTARLAETDLGVSLIEADGTYRASLNHVEAERTVDEMIYQMNNSPSKSIAVVTMNIKQKEHIRELYQQEASKNKIIQAYETQWANNELEPSPLIRNLEAIQGDERDTVIISTVFGPDESGHVAQNFGDVNKPNGARRLNVLFTRAKEKVILITSLSPSSIKVDETRGLYGPRVLRDYISYAKNPELPIATASGKGTDSDFEDHVILELEKRGFSVEPQVSYGNYRIDIGVRHKDVPHSYIAGIECDGATYHSSKSARDRDKIRQDFLESNGWRIYRIWSTDWFKDSNSQMNLLVDYLNQIKAELLRDIAANYNVIKPDPEILTLGNEVLSKRDSSRVNLTKSRDDSILSLSNPTSIKESIPTIEKDAPKKPVGQRSIATGANHPDISFYTVDNQNFYVWDQDICLGHVSKRAGNIAQVSIYANEGKIEKPTYDCYSNDSRLKATFDDIYKGVRWVFNQHFSEKEKMNNNS